MTSTEERMYELGREALQEQERAVSDLRARVPPLLAGAAVLGTLLAKPATDGKHPDGALEWMALLGGSVGGAIVLTCCTAVFGLYRLAFSPDARRTYDALAQRDLVSDPDRRDLALALAMSDARAANDTRVNALRLLPVAALLAFVVEAVLLGLAVTLTS